MNKENTRERVRPDAANGVSQLPMDGDSDQQKLSHLERRNLVLWQSPIQTFYYFLLELAVLFRSLGNRILKNKKTLFVIVGLSVTLLTMYYFDGHHQQHVTLFKKQFLWCMYWIGLGILSSVGLGTGLHTFLLYLILGVGELAFFLGFRSVKLQGQKMGSNVLFGGPHIAAVTLAAFECMSVNFPEPPYPDDIICPEEEEKAMSIFTIMSKVRLEAFMWPAKYGLGTAIGELPPYFMARASRLSGQIDEEEQEIETLTERDRSELNFWDKGKILVHSLIHRVGFAGILLCASIPNPLFDLAGITCGHFLIPFWTFFGATLIGKAIIKMHIQKFFVIFVFSERHVEHFINLIKRIPLLGSYLQVPITEYLQNQKTKLHHAKNTSVPTESSWLSWIFEKVVTVMVIYFVVSIINSMAQSYHKRQTEASLPKKAIKD